MGSSPRLTLNSRRRSPTPTAHASTTDRSSATLIDPGIEAVRQDCNYLATLSWTSFIATKLHLPQHVAAAHRKLLPFAGSNVGNMAAYLGPVSYILALLNRAMGDDKSARDYLANALADSQRMDARPWIEKLRREMVHDRASH